MPECENPIRRIRLLNQQRTDEMKVLGLESSGKTASVAIVEDGEVLAEYLLNAGITHSQTFLPMIDQMLTLCGTDLKEIDYLAVSCGPGSYTGLRIGIATAKGLALATGIPTVPVSTLAGLAQNLADYNGHMFTILFARAEELYYAHYLAEKGELKEIEPPQVCLLPEVLEKMKTAQADGAIAIVGDGFGKFENRFRDELDGAKLFIPDRKRHLLSAASIALAGEREAAAGNHISGERLLPTYLKKTQAEREYGE